MSDGAQAYHDVLVPGLFAPWGRRVVDAARLEPGQRVLDVACGTGALTIECARRVGASGTVVGLDPNEERLSVARANDPSIEWRPGRAESLPFADASFDAVVSQFGLMFFDDRVGGLREMRRVARPGGRLAVAVWGEMEHAGGYADLTDVVARVYGERDAHGVPSAYALGDVDRLRALFVRAGMPNVDIVTADAPASFPSLDAWLDAELGNPSRDDRLDLVRARMRRYETPDGTLAFTVRAHIATAAVSP